MAIIGIERLVYGVDDLQTCSKFWRDFGLSMVEETDVGSIFEVQTGSRVVVRRRDDCGVDEWFDGNGVKLAVWGIDTIESLDRLANNLARDRKVRQDDDGTIVSATDEGVPFGLRVWAKRPVFSQPDQVNAPGNIQRFNQLRKWRSRAIPKALNHVVFATNDFFGTYEFYKNRLGFKLSDHSRGIGAFLRGDADDPFDAVSGTRGITGGADSVLVLKKDAGTQQPILYGRGRDMPEFEKAVTFDAETCSWAITGDALHLAPTIEGQAIMQVLAQEGTPLSPNDIAKRLGKERTNVQHQLKKLLKAAKVQKEATGLYTLFTPFTLPLSSVNGVNDIYRGEGYNPDDPDAPDTNPGWG